MRTIQTTAVLTAGALLFGFFFRIGEDQVMAAPVGCLQWECVDVYAWWLGDAGTQSLSVEKSGTIIPDSLTHTTNASLNFYTPSAPGRLPRVLQDTWDRFTWTDNDPACRNQVAPQTVQTKGTYALDRRGYSRYVCTSP